MPDPHSSDPGCCGNERVGKEMANRPQLLSDSNHLQAPGQVSKTKGRRRDKAIFQKLIQNNQQKDLVSYIYFHSICISLITNEVNHVCMCLLAIGFSLLWYAGLSLMPIFL